MRKHRFHFAGESGGFNGYDRRKVWIDEHARVLRIGSTLRVPLEGFMRAELRPLPRNPKSRYLAIDVCGPAIEEGKPTTLALVHKSFLANTKIELMQAFVDEKTPLLKWNSPVPSQPVFNRMGSGEGRLRGSYALHASLAIAYYRKRWFAFGTPDTMVRKTLFLMLLGRVINVLRDLLVVVPFENYSMSRNLLATGWSRRAGFVAYLLLSYPAYVFWAT